MMNAQWAKGITYSFGTCDVCRNQATISELPNGRKLCSACFNGSASHMEPALYLCDNNCGKKCPAGTRINDQLTGKMLCKECYEKVTNSPARKNAVCCACGKSPVQSLLSGVGMVCRSCWNDSKMVRGKLWGFKRSNNFKFAVSSKEGESEAEKVKAECKQESFIPSVTSTTYTYNGKTYSEWGID